MRISIDIKFLLNLTLISCAFSSIAQVWSNDPEFNIGTGATYYNGANAGSVSHIVQDNEGKIFAFGGFTEFNGVDRHGLVRLNFDGSVDESFAFPDTVYAQEVEVDQLGRILFSSQNMLFRLLPDGQMDPSFDASSIQYWGQVNSICIQPDGKILVGGALNYINANSTTVNSIMRLNEDGSFDTEFTPPAATDQFNVYSICLQSDGKIVLGGSFNSFAGSGYNNLLRLESNGAIDYSFNTGNEGPNQVVIDIYITDDEKIIIGGNFYMFNNQNSDPIIRLHSDGSLDSSFDLDMPIYSNMALLRKINKLNSGKFLVMGDFYSPGPKMFRMNENGTVDTTFVLYTGANDLVMNSIEQPDGNLLICGLFNSFNSVSKRGITRLSSNCGDILTSEFITADGNYFWPVNNTTYTASGQYSVTLTGVDGCDSLIVLNLTIDSIYLNTVVYPTPSGSCTGILYASATGTPEFQYTLNGIEPTSSNSDDVTFEGLCEGYYDLLTIDGNDDTLFTSVLIPSFDNCLTINEYIDSMIVDSLGNIINYCTLFDQESVDSAFITDLYVFNEYLFVTWTIYSDSVIHVITSNYYLDQALIGVYSIQLSIICQEKAFGDYIVLNQTVYFNNNEPLLETPVFDLPNETHLYPNPTNGLITFNTSVDYSIYSISGMELISGKAQTSADLSKLPAAVYLVEMKNGDFVQRARVVKE